MNPPTVDQSTETPGTEGLLKCWQKEGRGLLLSTLCKVSEALQPKRMWYQSIQSIQANMVELVKDNMEKAQETQKRWYDLNARERSFEVGEKILVLLPISTNKLLAQWQF
eukprot:Em0932g2a